MLLTRESSRKNLLERLLLARGQTGRELDVHPYNKVAPFAWFLRQYHSKPRIPLLITWLGRTRFGNSDGLAIDRPHDSLPTRECLFETELDRRDKIVALALERRMFFLWYV